MMKDQHLVLAKHNKDSATHLNILQHPSGAPTFYNEMFYLHSSVHSEIRIDPEVCVITCLGLSNVMDDAYQINQNFFFFAVLCLHFRLGDMCFVGILLSGIQLFTETSNKNVVCEIRSSKFKNAPNFQQFLVCSLVCHWFDISMCEFSIVAQYMGGLKNCLGWEDFEVDKNSSLWTCRRLMMQIKFSCSRSKTKSNVVMCSSCCISLYLLSIFPSFSVLNSVASMIYWL